MKRLLSAYRNLWDKRTAAVYVTLLAILIASLAGLLVAIFLHTLLALAPLAVLVTVGLMLHFALAGPS